MKLPRSSFLLLRIAFLFVALYRAHAEEKEVSGEVEEEEENNDYLYNTDDATPVVEYLKDEQEDAERPEFIFGKDNGPRVVEFYAPWCPHCQHFRDHYIDFARQVDAVTEELGAESVEFYSISCTANRPLCQSFRIKGYPRIHLFPAGAVMGQSIEAKYYELHPFTLLNELGIEVDQMKLSETVKEKAKHVHRKHVEEGKFPRTKEDVFNDAYLSFDFNIRHGIYYFDKPLTNTTQTALHNWLDLLKVALPPGWKIHTVIRGLLDNFDRITVGEVHLKQVMDSLPSPPSKTWSKSCTKGVSGMGYSCGLWELFHIMTIGVVEYNMMLGEEQGDMVMSTVLAADTLRDFIANFFGCEECRTNFVAAYDTCSHDRCNRLNTDDLSLEGWMQLPLWLSETHNSVNVRLMKEEAERQGRTPTPADEVAKEWPSLQVCEKCWAEDGTREVSTYKYLRVDYWPEDFITDQFREELGEETEDDSDDLEKDPRIVLIPLLMVLGVGLAGYSRRRRLALTGRHKKNDF